MNSLQTQVDGWVVWPFKPDTNPENNIFLVVSLMAFSPNGFLNQVLRSRRRWVDNIKMDHGGIGWDGMDWIELAEDRDQWRALVNTVMNLRVF
jgi:hypothetical protein